MMHKPVMLDEMLGWLEPKQGGVYIDGTFGAGGYARAILRAADCRVFAIDRDPSTKNFAEELEHDFPNRFVWLLGNFADMCALAAMHGVQDVDGIVLDLGVSSMQIDTPARGFSFRRDGPLDMRMSGQGMSAGDVISQASEDELADIFYYYGEEKAARRIARAVAAARAVEPITRTHQLADIIRRVVGRKPQKTDAATRSFQGLRIYVNQEIDAVKNGLKAAENLLAPGGRLVVVTFHSLEDRLVKRFTHSRCGKLGESSRHAPTRRAEAEVPRFFLPRPEKRTATDAEIAANPRARSATMRMMTRGMSI
ncbi:MAG: 16S rRNA (cytosine(1402)-N(4))-methyltransferase RsmH [Pseudomonadota bacterium]|nr:16S rRNA (cytosine(1402)-N(4))-methyltransferase RsmH [Pseudomonadota bacterium]MDE3037438.1 16S rRNA (cytosine(1402)-N(4))-methyltransferase RsmH [Pseudomonadota bacterium]